jgi:hypothetical protein
MHESRQNPQPIDSKKIHAQYPCRRLRFNRRNVKNPDSRDSRNSLYSRQGPENQENRDVGIASNPNVRVPRRTSGRTVQRVALALVIPVGCILLPTGLA